MEEPDGPSSTSKSETDRWLSEWQERHRVLWAETGDPMYAERQATIEQRIAHWPSEWGDEMEVTIYGDFIPPPTELHVEALGITVYPEEIDNALTRQASCTLRARVRVEARTLDAVADAARRVNSLLGAWTLVSWGNSAFGWLDYFTRVDTGCGLAVFDNEHLPVAVKAILELPKGSKKHVDAALYWVRAARRPSLEPDRWSGLLHHYANYWNAFECLVAAACDLCPPRRLSKDEKQARIDELMARRSGILTPEDIERCYHDIVNPGPTARARHALGVCFPPNPYGHLAQSYAEECFDRKDKRNRLYQIRNDINHGAIDAESHEEQTRIPARLELLWLIVWQMFGALLPVPVPVPTAYERRKQTWAGPPAPQDQGGE
jgi:hypothetical protein